MANGDVLRTRRAEILATFEQALDACIEHLDIYDPLTGYAPKRLLADITVSFEGTTTEIRSRPEVIFEAMRT